MYRYWSWNGLFYSTVQLKRCFKQSHLLSLNIQTLLLKDIYCALDFCTGGTIINEEQVKESLKNGVGKAAVIRAKIEYDNTNKGIGCN